MHTRKKGESYPVLDQKQAVSKKAISYLLNHFFTPLELSALQPADLDTSFFSPRVLSNPPQCYDPLGRSTDTLLTAHAFMEGMLKQYGPQAHASLSIAYHRLGNAYHRLGAPQNNTSLLQMALQYYMRALKSDLVFARHSRTHFYNVSVTCNYLGMVCCELNLLDDALDYYLAALKIKTAFLKRYHIKDLYIADSYCNLATVYFHLDDHEKALKYYHKALMVAKNYLNDSPSEFLVKIYSNLGNFHLSRGSIDLAIGCFEKELVIYRQLQDSAHVNAVSAYLASLINAPPVPHKSKEETVVHQVVNKEDKPTVGNSSATARLAANKQSTIPKKYMNGIHAIFCSLPKSVNPTSNASATVSQSPQNK